MKLNRTFSAKMAHNLGRETLLAILCLSSLTGCTPTMGTIYSSGPPYSRNGASVYQAAVTLSSPYSLQQDYQKRLRVFEDAAPRRIEMSFLPGESEFERDRRVAPLVAHQEWAARRKHERDFNNWVEGEKAAGRWGDRQWEMFKMIGGAVMLEAGAIPWTGTRLGPAFSGPTLEAFSALRHAAGLP